MRAILDRGFFVIICANPKDIWSVPHCDIVGGHGWLSSWQQRKRGSGVLSYYGDVGWFGMIRLEASNSNLLFDWNFHDFDELKLKHETLNGYTLPSRFPSDSRVLPKFALYESIRGEQVLWAFVQRKHYNEGWHPWYFPRNNYLELVDVGSLGRLGCWVFGEIQYLHVLATSSIHPWKLIERFWVCRVSMMKDDPELLDQNNKDHIPGQDFHRSKTSWCFETRWIIRLFVLGEFVTFCRDWLWWCLWKCAEKTRVEFLIQAFFLRANKKR